MPGAQASALESRRKCRQYINQMGKEIILSQLGLVAPALTFLTFELWENKAPPELTVASGLGALGCLAVATINLNKMVDTWIAYWKERAKQKMHGSVAEIIAPLGKELPPEEKKALTDNQLGMTAPLLVSGRPDFEKMVLETVPDDGSSLSTVTKEREVALYFIATHLLDQEVIGADGLSCVERTEILARLTDILAPKPTSAGLTLTRPELDFLMKVLGLGAVTEKAPETKSAYLRKFARLIESYILHKRISPAGQDAVNTLMSQAVQAERLAGCSVSPPIGLWKDAQILKKEEKGRVVLTGEQLIDMAKSVTALANSRIPEVRETYMDMETFPYIIELLGNEKKRLEGSKEKDIERLAAINTVLFILQISINDLVSRETMVTINRLCGGRLAKKRRITPRDLIDEFKNTGFGSCSIEGDRVIVTARNISLVDPLACAAVICHPIVPRIEIGIGEDNKDNVVDQSAMIPTAVFYSQRLILNDRQFISSQLREQSPPAAAESPSPTPALLTDISAQPAS